MNRLTQFRSGEWRCKCLIYYFNLKRIQGNNVKTFIRNDIGGKRTNLGDAIYYFRHKIGLSLEELQQKSGISA